MRPRCFLDFDRTIFDTEFTNEYILKDATSIVGKTAVDAAYATLKPLTFSLHRFIDLLDLPPEKVVEYTQHVQKSGRIYQGVSKTLALLSKTHDLILITYGSDDYQKLKLRSVEHLLPTFKEIHVIQHEITKGEAVSTYERCQHDIFIDDLPSHLLDVRAQAPWVKLIRPMHPTSSTAVPHAFDNIYWTTVKKFEDIVF